MAAAVSFLVPQRIKVEGHNRYVVEFSEAGQATRAFAFTVSTDGPQTLVEPDAAFRDAMLPLDHQAALGVIRLVRNFYNLRQHFLMPSTALDIGDK